MELKSPREGAVRVWLKHSLPTVKWEPGATLRPPSAVKKAGVGWGCSSMAAKMPAGCTRGMVAVCWAHPQRYLCSPHWLLHTSVARWEDLNGSILL